MGYSLAPTLSYCRADGQRVFLDAKRDRYFCLCADLDARFEAWTAGDADPADTQHLARLVSHNVLVEHPGPDALPQACPAIAPPCRSLFDDAGPSGALPTFGAYAGFRSASLRLRLFGLATSLRGLERHKRRARCCDQPAERAQTVANAFRRAARFATTRHHCLPHALAVAHALCARNAPGTLVIGVRTRPFGAHAWVQCGDAVVNDSIDTVRDFTPIRLV